MVAYAVLPTVVASKAATLKEYWCSAVNWVTVNVVTFGPSVATSVMVVPSCLKTR